MREALPKPEFRSAAFSELRKRSHAQIERETAERVKSNPKPSEEEINAGAFREMLEPQVRDAVFEMRRKGYATESSGFGGNTGEVQQIDGNFAVDQDTERKLRAQGVNVSRRGPGKIMPYTTAIHFTPDKPIIGDIKAKWDLIATILPDKGRPAEPATSGGSEDFIKQYAPDRTDVLQRIDELRAQEDRATEAELAVQSREKREVRTARLTRERKARKADQRDIEALRRSLRLKQKK